MDGSTSTRTLKRRLHVCKHCNKLRRRHIGFDSVGYGCQDPQSVTVNLNSNALKDQLLFTPQTSTFIIRNFKVEKHSNKLKVEKPMRKKTVHPK